MLPEQSQPPWVKSNHKHNLNFYDNVSLSLGGEGGKFTNSRFQRYLFWKQTFCTVVSPPQMKKQQRLHNWEKQEVNPRTLLWLQANTNNSPHQKYVSTNNIHIPPGIKTQSAWKASGLRDKKEAAQHVQGCLGWSISPNTKPAPQPRCYFGVRSARVSHKLLPFFYLFYFFFPWQSI